MEWIEIIDHTWDDVVAHHIAELSVGHVGQHRADGFERSVGGNEKSQIPFRKLRSQICCFGERALGSGQAQRLEEFQDARWDGEELVYDVDNASLVFQILVGESAPCSTKGR